MPSQVIAFLRRKTPAADWTQEEIAELYRIEHALIQARFSIETDRGVTDEGDPWFVFCRSDGEVLVHIARSSTGYVLIGMGLPQPLTGAAIGDLSRAFVNRLPVNVPVRQGDGATLLVHPAATLAVLIGMIFVAHDGAYLAADEASEAELETAQVAPANAGNESSGKVPLHLFGRFADGVLSALGREAGHQEGTYLSLVCTIAAVMMGATAALKTELTELAGGMLESGSDQVAAAAHDAPQPTDSDIAMLIDLSAGAPDTGSADAQASVIASTPDGAELLESVAPVRIATVEPKDQSAVAPDDLQPALAEQGMRPVIVDADPTVSILRLGQSEMRPGDGGGSGGSAAPVKAEAVAALPAAASVHDDAASTNAQVLQSVLKAMATGTSEPATTMSAMAQDILKILPLAANPTTTSQAAAQPAAETAAAPAHPLGSLYPLFDAGARETLTEFLRANPLAQAIFYEDNVIVYDGDKDFASRPVTVQVWEFETGATIALVGHADHPQHG